jgi:DnaK suppressor protein
MTSSETERLTKILLVKQLELHGSMRNRDDILIEKAPDSLDEVQMMGERELAIRNLDRESSMLRQVLRALARITKGSYGVCLYCEEDITPRRIAALPWAEFCIKCQEQIDRREIEVNETIELAPAA